MSNPNRLTGLDNSFLQLESGGWHMHVGACVVFDAPAPAYADLVETLEARLHLIPRYRQRLAVVPLNQGRPVWVDDPQFRLPFHVRHTALPKPGSDEQLRRLAGRIFSQGLDRGRPLWEIWLVEGLADGRFALLSKTHHALIDGLSGVDIASVILDTEPEPGPASAPDLPWLPRPLPTRAQLLADAMLERATGPGEIVRGAGAFVAGPRRLAARARTTLAGLGALAWAGLEPAPRTPFNVPVGPHRRFAWFDGSLAELRGVKLALGGTVNDVILAAVAGALGSYMRRHDFATEDLVLKALVPVSVRVPSDNGALGNRVAAMWGPLPVGIEDPEQRLRVIADAMVEVKRSGQAVGARALTGLSGFASPTLVAQAARLQARQRMFNLVVTNVPGPQRPLYLLGRRMRAIYPLVPLAANTALAIAVLSYDDRLGFGLSADYDALGDLEALAADLRTAIGELVAAAAVVDGSAEARR
jgi:diacylglycerol O-acyltransferase / wax synthase